MWGEWPGGPMNGRQYKKGLPKVSPGNWRGNQETRTTSTSMSSPSSMEVITHKYGKESWLIFTILIFLIIVVIDLVWARNSFFFFFLFSFVFYRFIYSLNNHWPSRHYTKLYGNKNEWYIIPLSSQVGKKGVMKTNKTKKMKQVL